MTHLGDVVKQQQVRTYFQENQITLSITLSQLLDPDSANTAKAQPPMAIPQRKPMRGPPLHTLDAAQSTVPVGVCHGPSASHGFHRCASHRAVVPDAVLEAASTAIHKRSPHSFSFLENSYSILKAQRIGHLHWTLFLLDFHPSYAPPQSSSDQTRRQTATCLSVSAATR